MRIIRNFLVIGLCFHSSNAFASNIYLKGQLGLSVTTDGTIDGSEVDTQIAAPYPITLGLGVYVSPISSFALEINYETMDIDRLPPSLTSISSDTQTQVSAMLNYYLHAPKILILEPFVGVGVGYTQLTIEDNEFEGDGFTWQLTAGLDLNYSDMINLVSELRFFNPSEFSLNDRNNIDVGDFNTTQVKLMFGLKIKL